MPWPLNEIALEERRAKGWAGVAPGDFWRIPLTTEMGDKTYGETFQHLLSPEFTSSGRDFVIVIRLPDDMEWAVDHRFRGTDDHGWQITGELPSISAHPSIGSHAYHGWLKDGVLSDDLDGRTYPAKETQP